MMPHRDVYIAGGVIKNIMCYLVGWPETFEKEHYHVLEDIRKINFGLTSPEISGLFNESFYVSSNGKKNPMYYMTRDGFTLLVMGYTGEKAMKFKLAYIKQFNAMEKILIGKIKEREKGIAVRQALTKAIEMSGENERMHGHAYSVYTNIVYKAVFGKDAAQLREEYGIAKQEQLRIFFSEEELKAVQNVEMCISSLVGFGWGYDEIRNFVMKQNIMRLVA